MAVLTSYSFSTLTYKNPGSFTLNDSEYETQRDDTVVLVEKQRTNISLSS